MKNKFKNINTINLVEWYSKSSKKNNLGIEIKKLDNKDRDEFRHPYETLNFFGIDKNFKVLEISVRDLSFAYEFFQSINNKGVNLSAFDIIKAKMFENCSGDILYTDELNNNFNVIQANLGKIDPNSFLRHYWMSKYENITINKLLDKIFFDS